MPRLAENVGWLKLIGDALIEQRSRQARAKDAALSTEHAAYLQRKRAARRSNRKGARGLLVHLATAA